MSLSNIILRDFIVYVKPSTPVKEAVKVMYENGVGSVLIVDDDGRLKGIFTERDLVRLIALDKDLNEPVEKFMTKNVLTLRLTDDIWKALKIMIELGIRHVPVVDDEGRPIGVVSIRDLLGRVRAL